MAEYTLPSGIFSSPSDELEYTLPSGVITAPLDPTFRGAMVDPHSIFFKAPELLIPGRKPVGAVRVNLGHPQCPDFGCLFSERSGGVSRTFAKKRTWVAGSVGDTITIGSGNWRTEGVGGGVTNTMTVPTRWNNGGSITFVVQRDYSVTPATYAQLTHAADGSIYAQRQASDTSILWKIDFRTVTATVNTNIWDGKQHVISIEWCVNASSGPWDTRIDGKIEHTASPGAQGDVDISSTLEIMNRAAGANDSGLTLKAIYFSERPMPQLHRDPYQFLDPI